MQPDTLPNLLVVGAQKAGTTWLHKSLSKSSHIFGSQVKELNFFNSANWSQPEALHAYRRNFPCSDELTYYMESTPHYFRLPEGDSDIARRIHQTLGRPEIVVSLRNPIDRYESSYIHHMQRGRIRYSPVIDEVSDEWRMVSLGMYAAILTHWQSIFPEIRIVFYEDITAAPLNVVNDLLTQLGITPGLHPRQVNFRANDKFQKQQRSDHPWPSMPTLGPVARRTLANLYRDDVLRLQDMVGRELAAWIPH